MLKIISNYVYLVTFGGLNDTINQIIFCYKYCVKNKRILVVNTTQSRLEVPIQNYFDMNHVFIYQNPLENFLKLSNKLTKLPNKELSSLKISYDIKRKKTLFNNEIHNFDLNKKYEENIIVYANRSINGLNTKVFFELFDMKKEIIQKIKERYDELPKNYISVHIRNTDYKSNVPLFVETHKCFLKDKNIFLASDNKDSVNFFKNNIKAKIFTFTELPEFNDITANGIHKLKTDENKKNEINKDSIADLVILSLGEKIYVSCEHSGFSKNAIEMQKDIIFKKNILNKITNFSFKEKII